MKKVNGIYAAVVLAAVWFVGCQQAFAECGIASTYSSGTRTANGERYDHMGVSAAHKSLPFGTRVIVRNQRSGRSITVRINDRGPFVAGRIIDLSTGAKNALGMDGLAPVCVEVVSYGSGKRGNDKPSFRLPLIDALLGHDEKPRSRVARANVHKSAARSANSRHGRKHYAEAGQDRKRYARVHHRKGYAKKSSHRRQFASLAH
jgi:rare lipoprotein A